MNNKILHRYLTEAFTQLNRNGSIPEIEVIFYPYAGLNNTIRVRQRRVFVRISDVLTDAPPPVLRAIAFILVAKLFRRKIPKSWDDIYRLHAASPAVVRAAEQTRRRRGRKILTGAKGTVYDLESAFARLNALYFNNGLRAPQLSWSQRDTFRIFGHHDPVHNTIIVSRTLDNKAVPQYVLDYILYHEMLHLVHRPRIVNGRWYYHTRAFKEDEKKFTFFNEASTWFDNFRDAHARLKRGRRTSGKRRSA